MLLRSRGALWRKAASAAALAAVLAGAQVSGAAAAPKDEAPIPGATLALMRARDTTPAAPILVRAFKKEAELEVWKKARDGRYVHLKTFPICRWSGQLGPKLRMGDRQAPEGFYAVSPRQMNPNSAYHLSFDIGFPNAYDRAHGATGKFLMVHGICSSAGCYAMTDRQVEEIYALAREAFAGGQPAFQFQAYPFRMTAQNMARHRLDPHLAFWRQLKEGSDRFEATGEEPAVGVVGGRYVFAPSRDPAKEALAKARLAEEEARVAALVADGAAAVRTTYADGGQHPSFRALAQAGAPALGMVSRPEALALAGREIVLVAARKRPTLVAEAKVPAQALAFAPQAPARDIESTAGVAAPAAPAGTEASLLSAAPLGRAGPLAGWAAMPGSARILPPSLTRAAVVVAAR
jgi:murein L,D-transpeptidase YafK